MKVKVYTAANNQYVQDNYKTKSYKEIGNHILRSASSVRCKCRKMGWLRKKRRIKGNTGGLAFCIIFPDGKVKNVQDTHCTFIVVTNKVT